MTDGRPYSTLEDILRRDELRAAHMQRKFSGDTKGGAGVLKLLEQAVMVPVTLDPLSQEYMITVGIGSPAVNQTMLIDTGSDVPWVQCKPCSLCRSQPDPLVDPSSSSTYSPFSCGSATCAQLNQDKSGNGCSNSECQYFAKYGDGSRASGTYGSDTLTLGTNTIPNFQFGCGHVQSAAGVQQSAGLLGLGGGPESLVSQTAGRFGTAFSHCLPATSSSSGFLKLVAGTGDFGFVKTPMIQSKPIPTYYGVRLEAITSVFFTGMVVDSGAVITRLQRTAYTALSSAFKDEMKRNNYQPAWGILDTCFEGHTSLTVALVLSGGAVVDLDPRGIMLDNCLAFEATDDSSFGIIGNMAQRTFEVLYDIGGQTVGFKAGVC